MHQRWSSLLSAEHLCLYIKVLSIIDHRNKVAYTMLVSENPFITEAKKTLRAMSEAHAFVITLLEIV